MQHKQYVYSTIAYFIVGIVAVFAALFFLFSQNWFLVLIAVLVVYVALDNTFCSSRAQKCGIQAKGHYTIPTFFKKK